MAAVALPSRKAAGPKPKLEIQQVIINMIRDNEPIQADTLDTSHMSKKQSIDCLEIKFSE